MIHINPLKQNQAHSKCVRVGCCHYVGRQEEMSLKEKVGTRLKTMNTTMKLDNVLKATERK